MNSNETELSTESHPDPEPGWSSPVDEGTSEAEGIKPPSAFTWGQALLAGSSGDQQYIHNVLQHITAVATERHQKRKRHHRHKHKRADKKKRSRSKSQQVKRSKDGSRRTSERGKTSDPRQGSKRRLTKSSTAASSSSDEEDSGSRRKYKRRRRRETDDSSSSTVAPLLQMVMSDLSRGFFTGGSGGPPKKQERGLPQGLGLGEGLGLGATTSSHSTATMPASAVPVAMATPTLNPPLMSSALSSSSLSASLPRQVASSSSSSLPSSSSSTAIRHSLLEAPRFPLPLLMDDRRLPPPLPLTGDTSPMGTVQHTRPLWVATNICPLPVATSSPQYQPQFPYPPSNIPGRFPSPRHPSRQHALGPDWQVVDPPSDGEVGSPNIDGPRLRQVNDWYTQEIQSGWSLPSLQHSHRFASRDSAAVQHALGHRLHPCMSVSSIPSCGLCTVHHASASADSIHHE